MQHKLLALRQSPTNFGGRGPLTRMMFLLVMYGTVMEDDYSNKLKLATTSTTHKL